MISHKKPEPAKLVCPVLAAEESRFERVEMVMQEEYGPIDLISATWNFDFTDYYEEEMGTGLKRRIYSFRNPIDPARLADIKVFTNMQEKNISQYFGNKNGRAVNLDPGYVCQSKLVLASTKDYSHRVYLHSGIFAEITLQWKGHGFMPLETTYPDYRSKEYRGFFAMVRSIIVKTDGD